MNTNTPNHVAIIMDGNGRWGQLRGLERVAGHRAGVGRAKEAIRYAHEMRINVLTLWAFSTDNWKRPGYEVKVLMNLLHKYIVSEADELHAMSVQVTFIGNRYGLPERLQRVMQQLEVRTAANSGLHLQIALNYGGRDEIVRATKALVAKAEVGRLQSADVTECSISNALDTAAVPDPDLVIRTGREFRTSGFLLWQTAHAEWYYSEYLWPDFGATEFQNALDEYHMRDRRFGDVRASGDS